MTLLSRRHRRLPALAAAALLIFVAGCAGGAGTSDAAKPDTLVVAMTDDIVL